MVQQGRGVCYVHAVFPFLMFKRATRVRVGEYVVVLLWYKCFKEEKRLDCTGFFKIKGAKHHIFISLLLTGRVSPPIAPTFQFSSWPAEHICGQKYQDTIRSIR